MGIIDNIYNRRKKVQLELRRTALKEAKRIAHILGYQFGAEEVLLYGSLAKGKYFDSASDIDMVVKGIDDKYFRAYGYCIRASNFNLDIRAYEDMPSNFQQKITKQGKQLYVQKQNKNGNLCSD